MKNFWKKLPKSFLALAPMAGITDQPFRLMCKKYGADVLYSEMVSSEAIWHNRLKLKTKNGKLKTSVSLRDGLYKTLKLIQFSKYERPYVVQIFGSNPEHMAYAAEYIATGEWHKDFLKITKNKLQILNKSQIQNFNNQTDNLIFGACNLEFSSIPDGIDVNMGCPARDVVKTGAGSALLKNQKLAIEILKAVKKKVKNIPVSVKTRLGYSDSDDILTFSKKLENAGASALAIHGRTYKQGFLGKADWTNIYKVKKIVKIPVIGNGGIGNVKDVLNVLDVQNVQKLQLQQAKQFNNFNKLNIPLDGIMIGQGAWGKPFLFDFIKKEFPISNFQFPNKFQCLKTNSQELKAIILEHAKLVDELKGQDGFKEFRKHFVWYLKGYSNLKKTRSQLNKINSLNDVNFILNKTEFTNLRG